MEAAARLNRQLKSVKKMRLSPITLSIALGLSVMPVSAVADNPTHKLCAKVAWTTLTSLCEAVLGVFPMPESQQDAATSTALNQSSESHEAEPELTRPLDLTLPPLPELGDSFPQEDWKPLLPPLFGIPRSDAITLDGKLIPNDRSADFDFDLSSVIDQIDGAEISIRIRQ